MKIWISEVIGRPCAANKRPGASLRCAYITSSQKRARPTHRASVPAIPFQRKSFLHRALFTPLECTPISGEISTLSHHFDTHRFGKGFNGPRSSATRLAQRLACQVRFLFLRDSSSPFIFTAKGCRSSRSAETRDCYLSTPRIPRSGRSEVWPGSP